MFRDVEEHQWSAEHIARHNVTLDEAREVIPGRHYATTGRQDSTLIYGRTDAGRALLVVAVPARRDSDLAFVVTARDMTAREQRAYNERMR